MPRLPQPVEKPGLHICGDRISRQTETRLSACLSFWYARRDSKSPFTISPLMIRYTMGLFCCKCRISFVDLYPLIPYGVFPLRETLREKHIPLRHCAKMLSS